MMCILHSEQPEMRWREVLLVAACSGVSLKNNPRPPLIEHPFSRFPPSRTQKGCGARLGWPSSQCGIFPPSISP
jgi:hypothetical protein